MRTFLDANVIFAAAHSPSGRATALWELAGPATMTLLTSSYALDEARRNLAVKSPSGLDRLEELLPLLSLAPEPDSTLVALAGEAGLPPADAPILAAAIGCRADLLVTGDRTHFGRLFGERYYGVDIVSLAAAIALALDRCGA